jgi:hypothetical protein
MKLNTARDINWLAPACGLFLAALLAISHPALGDEMDNGNDKNKGRLTPSQTLAAIEDLGVAVGTAGLEMMDERVKRIAGLLIGIVGRVDVAYKSPWLYKTVVLKSLQTDLRGHGKVVLSLGDRAFFHRFTVEWVERGTQAGRLWVVDKEEFGLKGWVKEDEVVLEDQARAFFTGLIERDPRSADAYYQRGSLDNDEPSAADVLKALGPGLPPIPPFNSMAEGAIADLNEAMRLDPAFVAMARVALSKIYSQRYGSTRALAELTEAIARLMLPQPREGLLPSGQI